MMNTNAARSHATLAAILFFIYGISQFLLHIWNYARVYYMPLTNIPSSIAAPLIIGISFGVIAIIRANNLAGVIITGIGLLIYFIDFVQYPCLANFIGILSGASLMTLMLFVSIDPLKKLAPWVEQLWFIAPVLFMINYLVFWISSQFFTYFTTSWTYLILLPITLIRFFATFFFTMWLKDEAAMIPATPRAYQNTISPTGYASRQNPTSVQNAAFAQTEIPMQNDTPVQKETPIQNNSPALQKLVVEKLDPIESLKLYKEMLDNGTITQEAFEEKKQQLMRLI